MPRKPASNAQPVDGELIPATSARGPGRPTLCTPQVIDYICQELAKGIPLTVICRGHDQDGEPLPVGDVPRPGLMPKPVTVIAWQAEDPAIDSAILRAREAGEVALLEQCMDIADDERHDWELSKKGVVTNEVAIGRAKLRIETRLKLLAKFNPRKWGDKIAHEHSGKVGLESLVAGEPEPAAS